MRFADTNVLIYRISADPAEGSKRAIAEAIVAAGDLALSAQVLQEFYVQSTRKTRPHALSQAQATRLVEAFSRFPVLPVTLGLVRAAIASGERFGISYWDAAIIEAARASGCAVVLSEDLAHGQTYDGVTVENPFLTDP